MIDLETHDSCHFHLVFQLSAMSFVVDTATLRIDMSIGPSMFWQSTIMTIDNRPIIYLKWHTILLKSLNSVPDPQVLHPIQESYMWCTPTKQGTSLSHSLRPTLRYRQLYIVGIGMKHNSSVNFEILILSHIPKYVFYHLHVISDWFSNIFPQKYSTFSAACQIQNCRQISQTILPMKQLTVRYLNGHISKSRSI